MKESKPGSSSSPKRIQPEEAPHPSKIQEVLAAQIGILNDYYDTALSQAKWSFYGAIAAAVAGFALFGAAVLIQIAMDNLSAAAIGVVSGSVVEVIAGVNFYLYIKPLINLLAFKKVWTKWHASKSLISSVKNFLETNKEKSGPHLYTLSQTPRPIKTHQVSGHIDYRTEPTRIIAET